MNSSKTDDALARLAEDPSRAGLFLDVDGVLAPIVPRPEDARVPEETRVELRRLNERYALVACITGRAGETARQIVGVPELTYVGNHGLELEPESMEWSAALHRLLAEVDWPHTEDKRLTAALHYRDLPDEEAARAELEAVAAVAREAGFVTRFGRKVLDIVPPLRADKGKAVRVLLERNDLDRALVAGDDTTDLDAFHALDGLALAVRIAVASDEGPTQLREEADLIVRDPMEFVSLLRRL
jgi:trehalose 6-phosphate phosphatase